MNDLYTTKKIEDISEKAKEIVGKFMDSLDSESREKMYKILSVSLYAIMPDADNAILEPLEEYCVDLTGKLDKEEIDVLKKEFCSVVRYCYEQYGGQDLQHLDQLLEIRRYIPLSISNDEKVLLPYANEARFIQTLNGPFFCYGYEPNPKKWAFSQILCRAYEVDNAEIQLGDSLKNHDGEMYDYIFAQLFDKKDVGSIVEKLCDLMDNQLKKRGRMCCLLPESFCYAPEWYEFRKKIAKEDDCNFVLVISLPALFPKYTKDNICILFVAKEALHDEIQPINLVLMNAKNKEFFNQINLVDGSSGFSIKTESIIEAIFETYNKSYACALPFSKLTENLNFLPSRYLNNQHFRDNWAEFVPSECGSESDGTTNLPHLWQSRGLNKNNVIGAYEEFARDFHHKHRKNKLRQMAFEKQVVSLYAIMEYADNQILETLAKYRDNLTEMLCPDSISLLRSEYKSIVDHLLQTNYYDNGFTAYMSQIFYHSRPPLFKFYNKKIFNELCLPLMLNPIPFQKEFNKDKEFKPGSRVLLPYAGNALFSLKLNGCLVDAYEPDRENWAFAQIFRDAYDMDTEIKFGNAFGNSEGELYDYVFANILGRKNLRSVAKELYNIADNRLKSDGVMCCVLPQNFCYASEWYGFRKILKKNQYSAVAISLPEVLGGLIRGNICVFCLYKGVEKDCSAYLVNAKNNYFFKKLRDRPFVDGDGELVLESGDYDFDLKIQTIFDVLSGLDTRYMKHINDFAYDHFNLMPQGRHYFYNDNCVVKLKDIVKLVASDPYATHYKRHKDHINLSSSDLSTDYHNCDISYEKAPNTLNRNDDWIDGGKILAMPFLSVRHITDECLLASCLGGKLKVGKVVGTPPLPLSISNEIISFKLKSDKVSEDFLLMSLMSDNVAKQAMELSWGGLYNSVDPEEFLQIWIELPSKEEQERICKEKAQEKLKEVDKKLLIAYNKLETELKETIENLHSRKHEIGQTIFDINNWWNVLQRAREENGGNISDDTVVGNRIKTKVSEIYDGLHSAIYRLQQQVSKMDRGNAMNAEVFSLAEFIEDYIKNHQNSLFEFEYKAGKHRSDRDIPALENVTDEETGEQRTITHKREIKKGEPYLEEYVEFPREALTIVFDNIVNNACSHGFANSSERNKIRIDFEWVGGYVVATVSNNGKPLPEDFSPSDVFIYGKTEDQVKGDHFGIGGYEIKRLMREFGGDVEIESTPEKEFTVSYKLSFPTEETADEF